MGRLKHIISLLMLLWLSGACVDGYAQRVPNPVKSYDHIILLLDLNRPDDSLDSLLTNAGVAKPEIKNIKNGNYRALQKAGWNTVLMPGNKLRIDRPLTSVPPGKAFAVIQQNQIPFRPGYPVELYGVNNFARVTVHELPNGLTRFFVPGRSNTKRVMLSGSFNDWSTLKGLMLKTDSGWIKDVKLEPGAYEYKYIFDGNWAIDGNNNLHRDDGAGNTNSVYYRYNFTFKLTGYGNAHRVVVIGSFNNWNPNQLIMEPVHDGWQLNLYLHDGMHLYRFLVDGNPITDPDNRLISKDVSGNKNSVLNLGATVSFRLSGFDNAKHVYVAGDFNNWVPDELVMKRVGNAWVYTRVFAAGNYQYKFIVDGQWMVDPTNPHTARLKGETNSLITVGPNHIFSLKGYANARSVSLSGTFNNWDHSGYTMEHKGDEWVISMRLKPGKQLYKFIVNGDNWIIDPGNKLWEQNAEHTGNSVLWME